jgi:hypothetical protein
MVSARRPGKAHGSSSPRIFGARKCKTRRQPCRQKRQPSGPRLAQDRVHPGLGTHDGKGLGQGQPSGLATGMTRTPSRAAARRPSDRRPRSREKDGRSGRRRTRAASSPGLAGAGQTTARDSSSAGPGTGGIEARSSPGVQPPRARVDAGAQFMHPSSGGLAGDPLGMAVRRRCGRPGGSHLSRCRSGGDSRPESPRSCPGIAIESPSGPHAALGAGRPRPPPATRIGSGSDIDRSIRRQDGLVQAGS